MKKRVLFLCTGNSCRSQIAEGILRHLGADKFLAFSAGLNPAEVHPLAIRVMDEIGVDISEHRSKSLEEFSRQQFDYVITVCDNARKTCPVFPFHVRKLHWSIEDPALAEGAEEETIRIFRRVRNEIKEKIIGFLMLPKDSARLKCPGCGNLQEVSIPQNSCLHFYECTACRKLISPAYGSCCVICSYSDKNCPSFLT